MSAPGELVARARAFEINLSAVFEAALVDAVRTREREQWLEQNRRAIDAYNADIETHGPFSDGRRQF